MQPDSGYQKTRAELLNYELTAFAALRAGVPNCYRDAGENTAWGWILRALAREMVAVDYANYYNLTARDPALLTPADLLRQFVPFLPLGKDYPSSVQFDEDFKTMVLKLLDAFKHGARSEALVGIVEAFTGASEDTFTITEMFQQIGQIGIDVSYRNTVRVEVPIGGSSIFSQSPNIIQDVYNALMKAKASHVGIDMIGKYTGPGDWMYEVILGINDRFKIFVPYRDGAIYDPMLTLAPGSDETVLAPGITLSPSYQWYRNDHAIDGATDATYAYLASVTDLQDDGITPSVYYVKVTDPTLGSTWSMQIVTRVVGVTASLPRPYPAAPPVHESEDGLIVVQQPMARSVYDGDPVSLTVVVADKAVLGVLAPHESEPWAIKSDKWTEAQL